MEYVKQYLLSSMIQVLVEIDNVNCGGHEIILLRITQMFVMHSHSKSVTMIQTIFSCMK